MHSSANILVVDDDEQILSFLDSLLREKGYACDLASNAAEAKQKLAARPVDLVLCDIMMPDMSGVELCKNIRTNNPETAVLMVTGLEDSKTIDEAIKAGADGYIVKPIQPRTLMAQIASAIYHRKYELLAELHTNELEKSVKQGTESLKKTLERLEEEKKAHKEKIKFLYKLFNTVQTGVILVDAQTQRITDANDFACKLIGASRENLIGKICHKTLCPANPGQCPVKDHIEKISNTERALLRTDGTEVPVLKSVEPLELDGKPYYIESFVDLSERKRLELDLISKEKRLSAITECAKDAIVMLDHNGRISVWNESATKLFGYPKEYAIGKDLHQLIAPPRYLEAFKKAFVKFQNTGKGEAVGRTLELTALKRDGNEFPVELSLSSLQLEGRWHAVGIIRDITERKLMMEALKESEELYRSLVESTTDAIVHLDNQRNILSCNKAFLDTFGYEKQEIVGKSIRIIHNSDESFQSFGKRAYPTVAEKGSSKTIWTFITRQGQEIPFETTTSGIRDRSGKITGYVSVMRDITERLRAEEALRNSEEKYRVVVENIKEGIVVVQDGMLRFVNPAMSSITGFSKEELLTTPPLNLIHPEDRDLAITNHKKRLEGKGVPQTYLMRIIDKQGNTHWIENSGVVIEWEGKPATLNFLTDVTQRRLAEEEFRRAHYELEDLIKSISSILIELSPDGRIKRWNRVAEDVFGLRENQVAQELLEALPIKWEVEKITQGLKKCGSQRTPVRLQDIPFKRRDGTRGFLGITITPKVSSDGALKGFIITASDITERRNLETQLLQAQKLESVGQLAAGIAHEINTPTQFVSDNIQFLQEAFQDLDRLINAYKGLTEQIVQVSHEKPKVDEIISIQGEIDLEYLMQEIPKAIEQSMDGVRRVAKIVRAMKEFSHPGSDQKTFIDLNHAIENTITVARNEWKYVADLETHFDPSLPPVPCLPGELNQVILNIVVNAAHAISDVVERQGGKGKIIVSTKQDGQWVEIKISDTGTGIPESIRERIFDPFFTTKEVGKGTGQGLAISRSVIVDKHGGTIDVETEVGKGTTFIIRLPLNEKGPHME